MGKTSRRATRTVATRTDVVDPPPNAFDESAVAADADSAHRNVVGPTSSDVIRDVTDQRDLLHSQLASANQTVAQLRAELSEERERGKMAEATAAAMTAERLEHTELLKRQLALADDEICRLRAQTADRNDLEDAVAAAQDEIRRLQSQVEDKEALLGTCKSQLADANRDAWATEGKLAEVASSLKHKEAQLAEALALNQTLAAKMTDDAAELELCKVR
jgi:chromosome segregation ATPase